mmetsp:Transcript_86022/g.216544  ORF Transcript_86022/g.216544 Transcript_86022/m.216544 type:complete len:216 (-) Transcript_86022:14-661(-)
MLLRRSPLEELEGLGLVLLDAGGAHVGQGAELEVPLRAAQVACSPQPPQPLLVVPAHAEALDEADARGDHAVQVAGLAEVPVDLQALLRRQIVEHQSGRQVEVRLRTSHWRVAGCRWRAPLLQQPGPKARCLLGLGLPRGPGSRRQLPPTLLVVLDPLRAQRCLTRPQLRQLLLQRRRLGCSPTRRGGPWAASAASGHRCGSHHGATSKCSGLAC